MKKKRTLLGVLLTLSMVFTTCLLPVFASVETSAETSTETESFTKKNVVVLDPGHGEKTPDPTWYIKDMCTKNPPLTGKLPAIPWKNYRNIQISKSI